MFLIKKRINVAILQKISNEWDVSEHMELKFNFAS